MNPAAVGGARPSRPTAESAPAHLGLTGGSVSGVFEKLCCTCAASDSTAPATLATASRRARCPLLYNSHVIVIFDHDFLKQLLKWTAVLKTITLVDAQKKKQSP